MIKYIKFYNFGGQKMIIGSNAGHTKSGLGSGSIDLLSESICTRQINNYFIKGLSNINEHKVFDFTVDYSNNYLSEIVYLANKQKLDYAISHHLNHSDDNSANGVEVWIYDIHDKETYNLASRICEELSKIGFKNRGVKENKKFYWLKNTNAKAMIIEYLFCSNKKDVGLYNPQLLANSVIKAITNNYHIAEEIKKYKNGDYDTRAIVINTKGLGLNVRADRTSTSLSLGKLKEGQEIVVNYCLNNWFSTYALGKLGYISGEYIKLL